MTAIENQERREEKEPEKTDANIDSEAQVVAHRPHKMVFHDFDYLNPLTMRPQGLKDGPETQKPRGGNFGSMPKMGTIVENPYRDVIPRPGGLRPKKLSPGKSQRSGYPNPVYLRSRQNNNPSERRPAPSIRVTTKTQSDRPSRLGGHKTQLRAL